MKIRIESNFVVPGLEQSDYVEIDRPSLTLRELLKLLSEIDPASLEFFKPGAEGIDPFEWEVNVNGVPYHRCEGRPDVVPRDGDSATIKIMHIGGG